MNQTYIGNIVVDANWPLCFQQLQKELHAIETKVENPEDPVPDVPRFGLLNFEDSGSCIEIKIKPRALTLFRFFAGRFSRKMSLIY